MFFATPSVSATKPEVYPSNEKISELLTDEEKKQLSYLGSMLHREPTEEEAEQQPRERNTGKPADRSGPGGPPDELSPETLSKIQQQFDPYELAEERCADRYALQRLRAWRIRGSPFRRGST
jgi:hypothetical protein